MATDRESILKLRVEQEGMDALADDTRKARQEIERLGEGGEEASQGLDRASESGERLAATEGQVAESASVAAQEIARTGAVATEAGQEIASSAAAAAQRVEEIGDAATASAAETVAANEKVEISIGEVVGKIKEEIAAVRAQDAAYEEQIATLNRYMAELAEVADLHRRNGTEASKGAEATRAAIAEVRRNLAEVNAELERQAGEYRGLSADAQAALAGVKTAHVSVNEAVVIAANAIRETNEQYEETGRIAPRQLGFAVQAVEALRIAMAEQGEVGETTAASQVAAFRRLEEQLEQVTVRANALTNAARDNAVGLKETGNRVAGISLAVQDLGQFLGPTGAAVGNVAARIGLMGANIEQAKDAFHGLNINQLGVARSGLAVGAQVAAVAATAVVAAKAGHTLATTNRENKEAWDAFIASLKESYNPIAGIVTRLDALQASSSTDLDEISIALARGRPELDLYRVALRENISELEANKLAVEENLHVLEFFRDAQKNGAEGLALWRRAVTESGGSADKLSASVRQLRDDMDNVATSTKPAADALSALQRHLSDSGDNVARTVELAQALEAAANKALGYTAAERERLAIIAQLFARGKDMTDQQRAIAAALLESTHAGVAATQAGNQYVRTLIDWESAAERVALTEARHSGIIRDAIKAAEAYTKATSGTTTELNEGLAALSGYIAGGAQFSEQAGVMAAALNTVLAGVTNLTTQQRANIQAVIDAGAANATLTLSEREYAVAVIASIIEGKNKVDAMQVQIGATQELKDAITNLLDTVNAETAAQEESASAIGAATAAAREQLAANAGLDVATRARLETIVLVAEEIDQLQARDAEYKAGLDALAGSTNDAAVATQAHADAVRDSNAALNESAGAAGVAIGSLEELQARRDADFEAFRQQTEEQIAGEQAVAVAISGKRAEIARDIEDRKLILAALAEQNAANEAVAVSTEKIVRVGGEASRTFTNLGDSAKSANVLIEGAATTIGGVLVERLSNGEVRIRQLKEETEKTGIEFGKFGPNVARTGEQAAAAIAKMKDQMITDFDSVERKVESVITKLGGLVGMVQQLDTATNDVTAQ